VGAVGVAAAVLFQETSVVLELAAVAAAGAFVLPKFLNRNGDAATAPSNGTLKRQVKSVPLSSLSCRMSAIHVVPRSGQERSAGSWTLNCQGVRFSLMLHWVQSRLSELKYRLKFGFSSAVL
jgi:hypothetical protein